MRVLVFLAALGAASGARAAQTEVRYGPPPAWVKSAGSPPTVVQAASVSGLQVLLNDSQTRFDGDEAAFYSDLVVKIASPDGLAAIGTLTRTWDAAAGSLTVHRLNIIRGDKTIDVLTTDKFTVLRRENGLEQAVLDGRLTATLQIKGLQVGDIVDFAATATDRQAALQGHVMGAEGAIWGAVPGRIRMRFEWPKSKAMRWRATPEIGKPVLTETATGSELTLDLNDVKSLPPPDGAPLRYMTPRLIELTDFSDWGQISALSAPLYSRASALSAASPLKAEIEKIRAAAPDPETRAALALTLVQDKVRYVFIGLDGGGYVPANADETWSRRFGDCKGKTALLLAILSGLGIDAEPALVNSKTADGLNEHLPRIELFNHVLVRAKIGGKTYWLDGTGQGDHDLDELTSAPFKWALPLRTHGAFLEPVSQPPLALPTTETVLQIDATAGLDKPVTAQADMYLRGEEGKVVARTMAGLGKEDADRALHDIFGKLWSWLEPSSVAWSVDDAGVLRISMRATGDAEWRKGDATTPAEFEIDDSAFARGTDFKRGKDQDKSAPYRIEFPTYERWVIIMKLPDGGRGFSITGEDVDETVGGVALHRTTRLRDGAVVMVNSVRSLAPEISAADAVAANARMKTFPRASTWIQAPLATARRPDPPKTADDWVSQGYALIDDKRYDRALDAFDKALRVAPGSVNATVGRAQVFAARGDRDRALKEYDRAIATSAKPEAAYYIDRADLLAESGQVDRALQSYAEGIGKLPDSTALRIARAWTYADRDDMDHALEDADRAVQLEPSNAAALRARALIRLSAGRLDGAFEDADGAVRAAPDETDNLVARAAVQSARNRYDRALADYDEALRIDPLNAELYGERGDVQMEAGRYTLAIKDYDWALSIAPRSVSLLNGRCWTRAVWGQELNQAQADCDAALKVAPKAAPVLDSRAMVSLRQGRLDEAIAGYDAALAVTPRLAASLYGRGIAKLRKGDVAGGEADLTAAKAIAPEVETRMAKYGLTR